LLQYRHWIKSSFNDQIKYSKYKIIVIPLIYPINNMIIIIPSCILYLDEHYSIILLFNRLLFVWEWGCSNYDTKYLTLLSTNNKYLVVSLSS